MEKALLAPHTLSFGKFLRGPLLALLLGLALFYLLMRPPLNDFGLMVGLMSFTALASVFLAYSAYRFGWIHRSPRIRLTLMAAYALSGILVFFNVWVIARLMFASEHDLLLATVLLAFATGIAMSLGYFSSAAVTDRILTLNQAAQKIARGQLNTRIADDGRDEMAALVESFNEMAAQLQESDEKQAELERLRRDLIAWVSHDLRTPLTSIRAILEALADGVVDDPETVQRYLKTAQRDIRSLSILIDDLFEMAQMDAGGLQLERTPGSIADLISDTIEGFSEIAKQQGVSLIGSAAQDIEPVQIDVRRMGRVLANLVGNALRHTPSGGQIAICAARSDQGVQIEVEDTGEGIKPEELPRVFDRFYRVEKSRSRTTGGAGLGLAIARGIIEAHGGEITVESAVGKGTKFRLLIPIS